MRTAVLERTQIHEFESTPIFLHESKSRHIPAIGKKIKVFIVTGSIALILISTVVGALNAYATNLEIATSKTSAEIKRLDENMREIQGTLDSNYNRIITDQSASFNTASVSGSYFVKEIWEVGG